MHRQGERLSLIAELKRRNVFKASAAYLALGWVIIQITSTLVPALNLPVSIVPIVTWIGLIGFPFVIIFSWIYELTPEGLKRESEVDRTSSITHVTGRRLDYTIIVLLALAIALFVFDRLSPRKTESAAAPAAASSTETPATAAAAPATSASSPAADAKIPEQSIAVLPFVNMSSDKEQDFFSDGISEELLNLLAKVTQLQVAARTSSFSFKGKEVEIPEIARELHVAHVLEGSVRKSGNTVRITAQLIHASDGYHVWSQTWDRKLDDIFAIQDEIAADVVKQLKVTLLGAAPTARKTDPQAYALYLQAVQLGRQNTAEAFKQSDALLQQVLATDPRYAPAWTELSRNIMHEGSAGLLSNDESTRRAREAVDKALAIDPDYARAHAWLGWITMGQGELAGAAQHFDHALALDPADLTILGNATVLLSNLGRLNEAIALDETLAARDPVNVTTLYNLGYFYLLAGRYDEAIAKLRTSLSLAPGRDASHYQIGVALLFKNQPEAALAQMRQEGENWGQIGLPMAYHALGRKAESDSALATLIKAQEKDSPYNIAYVYAFRGEADHAFEWLDKAAQYADPGLSEVPVQTLFAKMRNDPRWLPFLRKIGKAPEQLEKIEFKVTLPQSAAAQ
jgi:adenylate cyclase